MNTSEIDFVERNEDLKEIAQEGLGADQGDTVLPAIGKPGRG